MSDIMFASVSVSGNISPLESVLMLHYCTATSSRTAAAKMCWSMSPRLDDHTSALAARDKPSSSMLSRAKRAPEPMPGKGALGLGWGRRRSQRRMYQAIGWVNDAKLVGITGRIFKNASIVRRRLPRVIGLGM